MRTLHLFAGAGGGLLADLILGHEPVCAVEWDHYCCQILRERAVEGWFPGLHVFEGDVRVFNASDWKGKVDCIHAGFPCQPHSVAGKRKGHTDDRNLWPEVVRVVGEIRPPLVFLENVPGIISNGFIGFVLNDLADLGYDARWTLLGADQVGAPHRRERWWLLANARQPHGERDTGGMEKDATKRPSIDIHTEPGGEGSDVANAQSVYAQRFNNGSREGEPWRNGWWKTEPDLGRVANGVASRVDRLKSLGNAQVPLQAAIAFKILMWRFGK